MNSRPYRRGPRPLADFVAAPLADTLRAAGFAAGEVVTRWDEIVGPDLAKRSAPLKIVWPKRARAGETQEPGVLHVSVEAPYILEAQFLVGPMVERVNAYFGWRCVGAVKLSQRPPRRRPAPRPGPPPADEARLARAVAAVDEPAVRAALERLGRAVGGSPKRG